MSLTSTTQSTHNIISAYCAQSLQWWEFISLDLFATLNRGYHSLTLPLILVKFKLTPDRNQSSDVIAEPVRVGGLKKDNPWMFKQLKIKEFWLLFAMPIRLRVTAVINEFDVRLPYATRYKRFRYLVRWQNWEKRLLALSCVKISMWEGSQ